MPKIINIGSSFFNL